MRLVFMTSHEDCLLCSAFAGLYLSRAPPPLPGGFVCIVERLLVVAHQKRAALPHVAPHRIYAAGAGTKRAVTHATVQVLLDASAPLYTERDPLGLSIATRADDRLPSVETLIAAVVAASIKHRGALQAAI